MPPLTGRVALELPPAVRERLASTRSCALPVGRACSCRWGPSSMPRCSASLASPSPVARRPPPAPARHQRRRGGAFGDRVATGSRPPAELGGCRFPRRRPCSCCRWHRAPTTARAWNSTFASATAWVACWRRRRWTAVPSSSSAAPGGRSPRPRCLKLTHQAAWQAAAQAVRVLHDAAGRAAARALALNLKYANYCVRVTLRRWRGWSGSKPRATASCAARP